MPSRVYFLHWEARAGPGGGKLKPGVTHFLELVEPARGPLAGGEEREGGRPRDRDNLYVRVRERRRESSCESESERRERVATYMTVSDREWRGLIFHLIKIE